MARKGTEGEEGMGRKLRLAKTAMKASLEVISMRAQYFRDITEQGVEAERQMAFLVEHGHDSVFSESYRTGREALTTKLVVEVEAAKRSAKERLERAREGNSKGSPASTADDE